MFYFYILKSEKNGRYYLGSTNSIEKRLHQHNSGSVRSTKSYQPWKLVYTESYTTITDARKRENQVKSWKSRYNIEKLINMAPSSNG